jgi:hypothetical protein
MGNFCKILSIILDSSLQDYNQEERVEADNSKVHFREDQIQESNFPF